MPRRSRKPRPKKRRQASLPDDTVRFASGLELWILAERGPDRWSIFDRRRGGQVMTYYPQSAKWVVGSRAGVGDFRQALRAAAKFRDASQRQPK